MATSPWASERFVHLKEPGFDIDSCHIDFASISIGCEDLTRYRKAFRVKIRALIKVADTVALTTCIDNFYRLAQFVRHLYGYHSCDTAVEKWQEQIALSRQKILSDVFPGYKKGSWLTYEKRALYQSVFEAEYLRSTPADAIEIRTCVQDGRAFLNPKDQAHFERWYGPEHQLLED